MQIPSRVFTRHRWVPLIPFAALIILTATQIPRLSVSGTSAAELPRGDPVRIRQEEAARHFPPYDFVVVSVERAGTGAGTDGDPYDPRVVTAVRRLSDEFSTLPGVASVLSMSTARDIRVSGDELALVPVVDGDRAGGSTDLLRRAVESNPLFRAFLVSRDGKAATIYVFTEADADPGRIAPEIEGLCAREQGVRAVPFGTLVIDQYVNGSVVPDLLFLGSIALLIVFLFELAATGSFLFASILWIMNLLPALWVVSFFPLAGLSLKIETMYAPIVIVAISTSYGVQVYRNFSIHENRRMAEVLVEITPVIFSAGVATVLGFTSLLAASLAVLRVLGAILVAGITLSIMSSLFVLPLLLSAVPVKRHRSFRHAQGLIDAARRPWVPIVFIVVMGWLAAGIPRIGVDYRIEKILGGRASIARTAEAFRERYGGVDALELILDTRKEYGWTDPEAFGALRALRDSFAGMPRVSQVICVTDFVDWAYGRLSGAATVRAATDERAIGETLELLSSTAAGMDVGGLIDPSDSVTRIVVRFDTGPLDTRAARLYLRDLAASMESDARRSFPDATIVVTGAPLSTDRFLSLLVQSQILGIFVFLALAFLFVALFLRSAPWALLSLLLPASGALFYLGLLGWLGVPLTGVTVLTIAAVMGVGIDGLLCLITFYRARRVSLSPLDALRGALEAGGLAIVQSALVIVLSLLCLLASRYSTFVWTGVLTGITFSGCTAVTLLVIPYIALRFERKFP